MPNGAYHLWLALSPHGFGHAAMTAPVVNELRRRMPRLRLTIQTAVPRDFLERRYVGDFRHVAQIPDFGFSMNSSTEIDLDASMERYRALHAQWPAVVEREAARIDEDRPDLVLANVPYVSIAAASLAGVPVVAMSSLNWADIVAHAGRGRSDAGFRTILAQMREAYSQAKMFLRCLPAMDMTLPNLRDIGPVGRKGQGRRQELMETLGAKAGENIGLIAFGGIDHALDLARWPSLPGWHWLTTLPTPQRPDIRRWEQGGLDFNDLIASCDVVIGKPGYGTFVEAGLAGTSVLYLPRPDWPECPHLENWLERHAACLPIREEELLSSRLAQGLEELRTQPVKPKAEPTGIGEAADLLVAILVDSLAD